VLEEFEELAKYAAQTVEVAIDLANLRRYHCYSGMMFLAYVKVCLMLLRG
jgi:ATP phosphoribosyltransferase regulatory subunit HisZ